MNFTKLKKHYVKNSLIILLGIIFTGYAAYKKTQSQEEYETLCSKAKSLETLPFCVQSENNRLLKNELLKTNQLLELKRIEYTWGNAPDRLENTDNFKSDLQTKTLRFKEKAHANNIEIQPQIKDFAYRSLTKIIIDSSFDTSGHYLMQAWATAFSILIHNCPDSLDSCRLTLNSITLSFTAQTKTLQLCLNGLYSSKLPWHLKSLSFHSIKEDTPLTTPSFSKKVQLTLAW